MKCLIIQTAFIGDVILATALVEQLRRTNPGARIDFLLRKGNESLLKAHPHLENVWVWDKKKEKYRGLWRLLQQIRRERYDLVVNCQRFAASGFLTAFSGARMRIGFDKNPFSRFFTQAVPHHIGEGNSRFGLPYLHEVDRNLSLIDHLTDAAPTRPRLYPRADERLRAEELAAAGPYVCIAPTSVWHTKQWPSEKWNQLIRALPEHLHVYLLGAPNDAAACEQIRSEHPPERITNLAGQISLLASAALMQGAQMNYVNDSAPLHLATAVNAPVTAIFCSTMPTFGFTPLSDQNSVWEAHPKPPCKPCGLHGKRACPEGHFKCAYDITIPAHLII
jgi:heptosyltransferase-2